MLFSCEKEPECMTCKTFITVVSTDPNAYCSAAPGPYEEWVACGKELEQVNGRRTIEKINGCTVTLITTCKSKW